MSLLCIYCHAPLTPETKAAHVLPKALGGRLYSKRTECSGCNEHFGRLEDEFAGELKSLSAKVGAVTADSKKIFARAEIPGRGAGRIWNGIFEPDIPAPKLTIKGDKRIRYHKLPRDDSERASVIARGLFDDGKTVDDFDAGRYELIYEPWSSSTTLVDMGHFTIRTNRREHRRLFTKFAVSLLGCFDENAARSTYLEPAIRFAREDAGDFEYWAEGTSPGSGLLDDDSLPRFVHAVETWTCEQRLLAKVRFFGRLSFTTKLAHWPKEPYCVAYAVDPLGVAKPTRACATIDGAKLGLVHSRSADELVSELERWIEVELGKIAVDAKNDPATSPPDPDKLAPMIRKKLARLWTKHGNKPRGGRNRKTKK